MEAIIVFPWERCEFVGAMCLFLPHAQLPFTADTVTLKSLVLRNATSACLTLSGCHELPPAMGLPLMSLLGILWVGDGRLRSACQVYKSELGSPAERGIPFLPSSAGSLAPAGESWGVALPGDELTPDSSAPASRQVRLPPQGAGKLP